MKISNNRYFYLVINTPAFSEVLCVWVMRASHVCSLVSRLCIFVQFEGKIKYSIKYSFSNTYEFCFHSPIYNVIKSYTMEQCVHLNPHCRHQLICCRATSPQTDPLSWVAWGSLGSSTSLTLRRFVRFYLCSWAASLGFREFESQTCLHDGRESN